MPSPRTDDFQATDLVSLHSTGRLRSTDTPAADGPRHVGHCCAWSAEVRAALTSRVENTARDNRRRARLQLPDDVASSRRSQPGRSQAARTGDRRFVRRGQSKHVGEGRGYASGPSLSTPGRGQHTLTLGRLARPSQRFRSSLARLRDVIEVARKQRVMGGARAGLLGVLAICLPIAVGQDQRGSEPDARIVGFRGDAAADE